MTRGLPTFVPYCITLAVCAGDGARGGDPPLLIAPLTANPARPAAWRPRCCLVLRFGAVEGR